MMRAHLEAGFDPEIATSDDGTALAQAQRFRRDDIARLLKRR